MIKRLLVLALIAACWLVAQPTPSPSPITAVTFARLPAASGLTRTYVVTDCSTASCTAGGGTLKITMVSNGSAWSPAGSGGGGGGAPAGSAGCVQLYATSSTFGCAPNNQTLLQSVQTAYYHGFIGNEGGVDNLVSGGQSSSFPILLNLEMVDEIGTSSTGASITVETGPVSDVSLSQIDYAFSSSLNAYGSKNIGQLYAANLFVSNGSSGTAAGMWGDSIIVLNGGGQVALAYGQEISIVNFGTGITSAFSTWNDDLGGVATNGYYDWDDSRGVRRVKEDNTFNSVGQAIEALYNPQFTKYTPGAVDFERGVLGEWESNVFVIATENGGTGTLRNIQLDGAEVDLGTSSHLVKINATTFKLGTLTCAVVSTVLTCT